MIRPTRPSPAPRRPRFRWAAGAILAAAFGAFAGGCSPPASRPPLVAASTPPMAELVEMVAGDRLPVVSLLPPGRSPHDFEPSPSDVDRIRSAVIFVYSGSDPDGWMRRSAVAVAGDRASTLAMSVVDRRPEADPHRWLDLDLVRAFLPVLAESLAARDPEGASGYRTRAGAALDSLAAFDRETRALLDPVRGVPFAILHPAFAAFARRYGLDLVAVLQPQAEGEALPRSLGDVTRELRRTGAFVVFAEPQLSRRLADAAAGEIEGRVAMLDPLGGAGVPGRDTYLGLLRWNARSLAENLGHGR